MNVAQKNEAIKNGFRKGFQNGSSKIARRKCYGYVINPDGELAVNPDEEKVICWIFEHYLAGASLGKIVDILFTKGIPSPTGNPKWTRAVVDKLLANKKYVPIVGVKVYLDAQFEKNHRCNVDYDRAGHPRKSTRYQSPSIEKE